MRCILSRLIRAGFSTSEKEGLQEVQVLEMERRSMQVRARLTEHLFLSGPESSCIQLNRPRECIHADQLMALQPTEMSAHGRTGAADHFSDATV